MLLNELGIELPTCIYLAHAKILLPAVGIKEKKLHVDSSITIDRKA